MQQPRWSFSAVAVALALNCIGGVLAESMRDVTFRLAPFGVATAACMIGELRAPAGLRLGLGALGTLFAALMANGAAYGSAGFATLALLSWACLLGGELFERILFFRALSMSKMPGAIGP